ncbi:MAG: hypothetical protein ACRBCK_10180 [Alphaproteobacteria bacterium]
MKLGLGLHLGAGTVLSGFNISTFVALGASLTDGAYKVGGVWQLCEDIAKLLYGEDVTIYERATYGHAVADQAASIGAILAEFDGQENVVFSNHIGGNNASYNRPTQFLDLSAALQSEMITDYESVIDAVEADGHTFVATALTFRDYNDATLDADPSVKVSELGGSYTYNEDWIKSVAASKSVKAISQYEYTRSIYDIFLSGDNVHATPMGAVMFAVNQFTDVMQLSKGRNPVPLQEVDFTTAFFVPDTPLDIVCAFGSAGAPNNVNVNWVDVPAGGGKKDIYAQNLHQTDGSNTGVSVLISGATNSNDTGVTNPADASATLTNSELLKCQVTRDSATPHMLGVIYGLQPNRLYDIEMVHGQNTGYNAYANSDVHIVDNSNNNIVTIVTRADPKGRIILRLDHAGSVGISGLRIKDGTPQPHYSIVVGFGDAVANSNINHASDAAQQALNLIDTNGNVTQVNVYYAEDGTNRDGIGNAGDSSDSVSNDDALTSSIYRSGDGAQDNVNFTGLPANRAIKVKFGASRPVVGGRTQDVSVNGGAPVSYDVNDNPITILEFDAVTSATGTLDIDILETNGANYSYKGAIQIDVY